MEDIKCNALRIAYVGSGCVNFGGAAGKEWIKPVCSYFRGEIPSFSDTPRDIWCHKNISNPPKFAHFSIIASRNVVSKVAEHSNCCASNNQICVCVLTVTVIGVCMHHGATTPAMWSAMGSVCTQGRVIIWNAHALKIETLPFVHM